MSAYIDRHNYQKTLLKEKQAEKDFRITKKWYNMTCTFFVFDAFCLWELNTKQLLQQYCYSDM